MLFQLRYRKAVAGIQIGLIEARDLTTAQMVGRAFCDQAPGYKYVAVEKAILADESILDPLAVSEAQGGIKPQESAKPEPAKAGWSKAQPAGRVGA